MSYRLSVTVIGQEELKRAFQQAPQLARREFSKAIASTAASIQNAAKRYAPVDQGVLRASIHTEGPTATNGNVEATVGTNITYAPYQEEGTGLYGPRKTKIVPIHGKLLVFQKGGETIFARSDKGVRPKWYFKRAKEENQPTFNDQMSAALGRIVDALAA